eukprot:scaffold4268_cov56-Phaeocystis_antarctica.AAC.2
MACRAGDLARLVRPTAVASASVSMSMCSASRIGDGQGPPYAVEAASQPGAGGALERCVSPNAVARRVHCSWGELDGAHRCRAGRVQEERAPPCEGEPLVRIADDERGGASAELAVRRHGAEDEGEKVPVATKHEEDGDQEADESPVVADLHLVCEGLVESVRRARDFLARDPDQAEAGRQGATEPGHAHSYLLFGGSGQRSVEAARAGDAPKRAEEADGPRHAYGQCMGVVRIHKAVV